MEGERSIDAESLSWYTSSYKDFISQISNCRDFFRDTEINIEIIQIVEVFSKEWIKIPIV